MVNTSSQLTESEKRRKQTLEKAKAIHVRFDLVGFWEGDVVLVVMSILPCM